MTKKRKENSDNVCSQCGSSRIRNVRRTHVFKGIVIENLPATYCPDCGEELYDAATVDLMEKIAAEPDKYAPWAKRRVARVA